MMNYKLTDWIDPSYVRDADSGKLLKKSEEDATDMYTGEELLVSSEENYRLCGRTLEHQEETTPFDHLSGVEVSDEKPSQW